MNKLLGTLLIASFPVLQSCEDNLASDDLPASKLTLTELRNDPGFADFQLRYNEYNLDESLITQASENFDAAEEKVVIFVKPSCSCFDTQETLPKFIKGLDSAGIASTNIEVYSMNKESAEHDYMNNIDIRDLPEFHIVRNGEFVYSILDSMKTNESMPIEYFTAEALK